MAEGASVTQQIRKRRATVPELYRKASKILAQAETKKGSVKNLIYSSGYRDVKPLYALVAETCKHRDVLEQLLAGSSELSASGIDPHLSKILITELIWGRGYLKPENARAIHTILGIESQLRSSLKGLQSSHPEQPLEFQVPRYVRVNTIVSSVEEVCHHFTQEGWSRVRLNKKTCYKDFLERVKLLGEEEFMVDFHLDFLLIFHSKAQFHDHNLLLKGAILLQEKASCMSAVTLGDSFDGQIIDACAAPGMKTTLLAALSNNQNPILAIERDGKRCKTLKKTVEQARATRVTVQCTDFLSLDPSHYEDVKYILVDPSCSGSGIVKRFEAGSSNTGDEQVRLKKLSSIQARLVEHAATFPSVERIVYSTCSIHVEENESVVREVLKKIGDSFRLEKALPNWDRRGVDQCDLKDSIIGDNCVRADASQDLTNGFFISLFVRR